MTPREIEAQIMVCPYFGGRNSIDRKMFKDGTTHFGSCGLEFHYRKVCPSSMCICAERFGLKGESRET